MDIEMIKDMLHQTGKEMLRLGEEIGTSGVNLSPQDIGLIRLAYSGRIKEAAEMVQFGLMMGNDDITHHSINSLKQLEMELQDL